VTAGATALVDRLVRVLLAEEEARRAVREALREQAELLRELRAAGLPASRVAQRVALARGIVLPVRDRLRLAERLRKRAWRGTHRPRDLAAAHGLALAADSHSEGAIKPTNDLESNMGKLIKRTITEEYLEDEDREEEERDQEDGAEAEEAEDDDEPAPRRRAKASRK